MNMEFDVADLTDPDSLAGQAARKSFVENGFFICKGGARGRELDSLHDAVSGLFSLCAKPGEDLFETCARLDAEDQALLYRVNQAASMSLPLSALSVATTPLWDVTREKAARAGVPVSFGPAVFFSLPADKRLVLSWHQESPYLPGIDCLANYWMPLFNPSSKANGTMSALVGSNTLGKLPYERQENEKGYTSLIPKGIDQIAKRFPEHYFECEVGDVVVFQKDLIHRSNFNASPKTRFTATVMLGKLTEIPAKLKFSAADY